MRAVAIALAADFPLDAPGPGRLARRLASPDPAPGPGRAGYVPQAVRVWHGRWSVGEPLNARPADPLGTPASAPPRFAFFMN